MNDIVKGLNNEQKEAVLSKSQHILVLAGAGTGKTQVLTKRIANLINLGVEPSSILSVRFTNKAAKEMKERIKKLIDPSINIDDIWIGTFHSICNRMLRNHPVASRLGASFQILDSDDQKSLVKQVIEEMKIFEAYSGKEKSNKIREAVKLSVGYINENKDNIKRPKNCTFGEKEFNFFGFNALKVYKEYEDKRNELEVVDFGDLMLYTVEMFENSKETLKEFQDKFKHILVDEFQDTNHIQYEWLKMLIDNKKNYLFVVGDDDQSIYGWRGANIKNILQFDRNFKDTHTIRLEQNYRSTSTILDCANTVIGNNKARKGKNLWSAGDKGNKVNMFIANTTYSEAEYVAKKIKQGIYQGKSPNDFAILYRTNAVSRSAESKLNEYKIPYRIIGGVGFWSRMEIKDVMSYVALIMNPKNNIALERTINIPSRGIGKKTFDKIKQHAGYNRISILDAVKELLENREIKPATKAGKGLQEYLDIVNDGQKLTDNPGALIEMIVRKSKIIKYYMSEGEEKGAEREQNIMELINSAENFRNDSDNMSDLEAFVNYASLQINADKKDSEEAVQMMTIHTAKGLEFPEVFLMGVEEGIFPSRRNCEGHKLEEERRLAYVGITRAEKELTLSAALNRFGGTSAPSRFMTELPESLVIKTEETPQQNQYGFLDNRPKSNEISKPFAQKRNFEKIKIGNNYNHKKYGQGVIISVKEDNDRLIVKVNFDFIGIKQFIVT